MLQLSMRRWLDKNVMLESIMYRNELAQTLILTHAAARKFELIHEDNVKEITSENLIKKFWNQTCLY